MHRLAQVDGSENPFDSQTTSENPHLKRSWGFAVAYKNTGLGGGAPDKAGAEVELYADGTLEVRTSSAELGQGLVTVLQMIVAEEFTLPAERVKVLVMDTDLTPDGGPTTASRQVRRPVRPPHPWQPRRPRSPACLPHRPPPHHPHRPRPRRLPRHGRLLLRARPTFELVAVISGTTWDCSRNMIATGTVR